MSSETKIPGPPRLKLFLARALRKIHSLSKTVVFKIYYKLEAEFRFAPYIQFLNRQLKPDELVLVAKYYQHLGSLTNESAYTPLISIILPVYKVPKHFLEECLESVAKQVYTNWELCIADDCSKSADIDSVLNNFALRFPDKVKIARNAENLHISKTSNVAIGLATGEYIALLDHDDRLFPNALAEVVRAINIYSTGQNRPQILYSDERTISENGEKLNVPFYKPSWAPWMHLSVNYTTHLSIYSKKLIEKIGGFRAGYEGSQDHDLMLRAVEASSTQVVHIPMFLYQWRAHGNSTALSANTKPYAATAGEKAVSEHLAKRGVVASVTYEKNTVHYRIKPEIPNPAPLISIVIPNKESLETIRNCLNSIFKKSTYSNFEVIISDNGSTSDQVLKLYRDFEEEFKGRFHFFIKSKSFNFGRQCNLGADLAKGEYLLFLNNDIEVITPDWLEELIRFAIQPEIGAVGCKLLYPGDTIQHAGIVTCGINLAVHAGLERDRYDTIYNNLLNTTREMAAVTGACMLTRKSLFFELGKFDEYCLPNGYGDVEYCLNLRSKGFSCLYTPYAELYHFESKTRGANLERFERFYVRQKYGAQILNDPYVNPNLLASGYYLPENDQIELDLNARQFEFFLTTPMNQWLEIANRMNAKHKTKKKR